MSVSLMEQNDPYVFNLIKYPKIPSRFVRLVFNVFVSNEAIAGRLAKWGSLITLFCCQSTPLHASVSNETQFEYFCVFRNAVLVNFVELKQFKSDFWGFFDAEKIILLDAHYVEVLKKLDFLALAPTREMPAEIISGLRLIPQFISYQEENHLLQELLNIPWNENRGRRVAHFGFDLLQTERVYRVQKEIGPLPIFLDTVRNAIIEFEADWDFNQCTIEEFVAGSGSKVFTETHSAFESCIVFMTVGGHCLLQLQNPNAENQKREVFLPSCSLLVLQDQARYVWTHRVVSRMQDVLRKSCTRFDIDSKLESNNCNIFECIARSSFFRFTFRKIRQQACACLYPLFCDWHVSESIFVDQKKDSTASPFLESDESKQDRWRMTDIENEHVHKFYQDIANHFSKTRHSLWPRVDAFLRTLPKTSFMADIGMFRFCSTFFVLNDYNWLLTISWRFFKLREV